MSVWDLPRSAWLPSEGRWSGPAFEPQKVTTVVIHYQGSNTAPANIANWARNVHNMTMARTPPYVFMYNAAIDTEGRILEGRGFDLRCAANVGHNDYTFAICLLISGQNEATPAQVQSVRKLVAEVRARCKDGVVIPHRQIGQTACPGAGVLGQLNAGMFDPKPEPPSPGGDVDMIMLDWRSGTPQWVALLYTGDTLAHVVDGNADQVLRRAKVPRVTVTDDELLGVIRSTTVRQPAPGPLTTPLKQAWDRSRKR